MDCKFKNKEQSFELEKKAEEVKEEVREIPDEKLEDVAGGTIPIISPWS